jgi:uncharacterized protein (DUF2252 family)
MNEVASRITEFNAGRDPERLVMKLAKLRADPFTFLRGTCHLFYPGLPQHDVFDRAPISWICGDLHLENFGTYKGDNGLAYFDINDFDEAALAPCTWDVVRFLVSVQLGARSLSAKAKDVEPLCRLFVQAYAQALACGKARWVERETAQGMVHDLLAGLQTRTRPQFLDTRTEIQGKRRRIRADGKKALPAHDKQREIVKSFLKEFAKTQPEPDLFKVRDVARRIAGTGSLGLERYIILVEGKGSPDGNFLLDLKQAAPSALTPSLKVGQPRWPSEAERVVTLQDRMQAISMGFVHPVMLGRQSYILRGLQPSEDRVALAGGKGKLRRLEEVVATMAEVTAWAHLRGSGRAGSAIADELVDFGLRADWQSPLLDIATACANQVSADWQRYGEAFDAGFFPPT